MVASNSSAVEIIPTMEITTIHTNNESSIHVEYFFGIQELEKASLKLNKTLLLLMCHPFPFFTQRLLWSLPASLSTLHPLFTHDEKFVTHHHHRPCLLILPNPSCDLQSYFRPPRFIKAFLVSTTTKPIYFPIILATFSVTPNFKSRQVLHRKFVAYLKSIR